MPVEMRNANPCGPLSEERLEAFERRIGTTLPADYRDFLLRYNGGKSELSDFWIVPDEVGSAVHEFFGLHDGPPWLSIEAHLEAPGYRLPQGLLPIADDGTGNLVCIRVDSRDRGGVYFWDHEERPADAGDSYDGITRIAGSFTDFLDGLHPVPYDTPPSARSARKPGVGHWARGARRWCSGVIKRAIGRRSAGDV